MVCFRKATTKSISTISATYIEQQNFCSAAEKERVGVEVIIRHVVESWINQHERNGQCKVMIEADRGLGMLHQKSMELKNVLICESDW